jgi:hypothetical protein
LDTPESITKVVSIPSQRSLHLVQIDNSTFVSCLPTTPNLRYITALVDLLGESRNSTGTARRGVFVQALAPLQLMPALHVKGSVIETVSDEEFGNLILNRIGSR